MFDYEILKLIWWLLIGVLLLGFAVMDGHDMGVGTLLPFIGKGDVERRVIINTVWPLVYATAFSGFYWAMLAVLWALFFRPVGFDYRSKISNPQWRRTWDWGLFVGGAVPPLIFGVAFGNLLQGVPFHFDNDLRMFYTGTFWQLLNPFALLAGVVSSTMITFHGANFLMIRTEGAIFERARRASWLFGAISLVAFALAGLWLTKGIPGFVITSHVDPNALPNPLDKTVVTETGAWLQNYSTYPLSKLIPVIAFAGGLLGILAALARKPLAAFIGSSVAMLGIIGTAGASMFPFVMPSSTDPRSSLTVWDSVSSQLTLSLMFWATMIFMPLIILYTGWAYRVMSGKVTTAYVEANDKSAY
jgi:cytochrome d ubiquinol oxidase subunit II